jgi:glutaredoxin-related protein
MIIQNPKTKQQLLQFIQSLKSPQFAYVDVLSKDDKHQVIEQFNKMLRKGPFTVLLIKD